MISTYINIRGTELGNLCNIFMHFLNREVVYQDMAELEWDSTFRYLSILLELKQQCQ